MKKEEFKEFVKKNPKLINYVKTNEMTWQKFYEMYDLYGEENDIWNEYIKKEVVEQSKTTTKASSTLFSFNEIVNWLKNVDLDGLKEGIGNVQRVLGVVQDFSKKDNAGETSKPAYKPRPLYKHFED